MAITPDEARAYVTNNDTVKVINTTTNSVVAILSATEGIGNSHRGWPSPQKGLSLM